MNKNINSKKNLVKIFDRICELTSPLINRYSLKKRHNI